VYGPHLPKEYIKIIPHPHSSIPATKIIALSTSNSECLTYKPQLEPCAWAPFETLADFEYTETAILGLLPKWIIDKQLAGFNSKWAEGSRLTIKTFAEMDKVLTKARKYFVQVSGNQLVPVHFLFIPIFLISSRPMLSPQLTRAKYVNLPLIIATHGNGSCQSFKTSPWHQHPCGMQFESITAQVILKNVFMMSRTRLIHGGTLM
jgi:hypothetical protein